MRPRAVKQAEGVYLGSIMLMLAGSMLQWPALRAVVGFGALAGATAFSFGLWALLLLFATRRGQGWARWGLVLVTAFAVLSFLWQISRGQVPMGLIGVIGTGQVVLTAIGAVLLFRPAANRWFARDHAGWEDGA